MGGNVAVWNDMVNAWGEEASMARNRGQSAADVADATRAAFHH